MRKVLPTYIAVIPLLINIPFFIFPIIYTFILIANPIEALNLALKTPSAIKYPNINDIVKFYEYLNSTLIVIGKFDSGIILNSIILGLTVSLSATLTALTYASICYIFKIPKPLIYIPLLALIPIPFIQALSFEKIFNPNFGILNYILQGIFHGSLKITIRGLAGVFIYQFTALYPVALVIFYGYINSMPKELVESSFNLGGKALSTMLKIIFPFSKPAIAASLTMLFTLSIDDVVGPIIFQGEPSARNLLSYKIYTYLVEEVTGRISLQSVGYALILLIIALFVFALGYRHIPIIYKSFGLMLMAPHSHYNEKPGLKIKLILAAYTFLNISVIIPSIIGILYAFSDRWVAAPLPQLGFASFIKTLESETRMKAIFNTLIYTSIALALSIATSVIGGYYTSRMKNLTSISIDILMSIPIAIPGIIVAYGYFHTFSKINILPSPLKAPWIYLIIAYSIRRNPYLYKSVQAMVTAIPEDIEEAAESLGAKTTVKIRRIIVPTVINSLKYMILITWIQMATEVSTSIIIGGLSGAQGCYHQAPVTYIIYTDVTLSGLAYANISSCMILITLSIIIAIFTLTFNIKNIKNLIHTYFLS